MASNTYSINEAFDRRVIKTGQTVRTNGNGSDYLPESFTGKVLDVCYVTGKFHIVRDDGKTGVGPDASWLIKRGGGSITIESSGRTKAIKTEKSKLEVERMLKEGVEDVKGFVKENRYVLYWVSLILLADHFIFGGEMRGKIQELFNSIINKVNAKITGGSVVDTKD